MPDLSNILEWLTAYDNDEIAAAIALVEEANHEEGCEDEPTLIEVVHYVGLLRRARGLGWPNVADVELEIRRRRT